MLIAEDFEVDSAWFQVVSMLRFAWKLQHFEVENDVDLMSVSLRFAQHFRFGFQYKCYWIPT